MHRELPKHFAPTFEQNELSALIVDSGDHPVLGILGIGNLVKVDLLQKSDGRAHLPNVGEIVADRGEILAALAELDALYGVLVVRFHLLIGEDLVIELFNLRLHEIGLVASLPLPQVLAKVAHKLRLFAFNVVFQELGPCFFLSKGQIDEAFEGPSSASVREARLLQSFEEFRVRELAVAPLHQGFVGVDVEVIVVEDQTLIPVLFGAFVVELKHDADSLLVPHIAIFSNVGLLDQVKWLLENLEVLLEQDLASVRELTSPHCQLVKLDELAHDLDEDG